MEGDSQYSYRKQYLGDYVRGKGRMNPSDPTSFTFYMSWLAHHWFAWCTLIFLIDNYYSFECFFWFTFKEVHQYAIQQLLPLNIVLLLILLVDTVFRVMVTPVLPEEVEEYLSKQDVLRLKAGHYFWWGWTGPLFLVYIVYVISYLVPYEAAQYLHLIYIARLVVLNTYFNTLYRYIHKINIITIAYTLFLMIYLILYLSTVFGCIFYTIDQSLIDSQYFGDPALNPNLYYQYTSFSFTPMESLSLTQRYLQAYYFSSGLVSTMAYGDVVGKNYIQTAYVMVLLVLSTIIIAYLLEQFLIMVGDNRFVLDKIVQKCEDIDVNTGIYSR